MKALALSGRFLLLVWGMVSMVLAADPQHRRVDYRRDIRPVLSDTCYVCHGPDEQKREQDLRLDQRRSAFELREGRAAIVPGDIAASQLIQRITSTDPDIRMPPPTSGKVLTAEQITLLTDWIRQGAIWTEHWSFVPPVRSPLPATKLRDWSRNGIDTFVLARMEQVGLAPASEAARETLLRRITLDLTGLPPTLQELDDFLHDSSPAAYEAVVDRLLSSPAYGEHMAVSWLDAARYADTSGYQNDGPRSMWRWRDWVIDMYNLGQPFDQFTVEQLAGDLLDHPTLNQRIATGFNRNHRGNAEGGIIPEEYQVEYVVDRVDTTATVWLGLTLGCARCHDHKYDPIRQQEYYQLYAYFNNIPESGRAIKEGNSPPYIQAPLPDQQHELADLDIEIQRAESHIHSQQADVQQSEERWQQDFAPAARTDWSIRRGLVAHFEFDGNVADELRDKFTRTESTPAFFTDRRSQQALSLDGQSYFNAGDTAQFGYMDKFSIAMWVRAAAGKNGTVISRMTPVEEGAGYYVHFNNGRVQLNLVKRWLDDALRIETRDPVPEDEWFHLGVVYDGTRTAAGIRIYINGRSVPLLIQLDRINQTFALPAEPLRIGGGQSYFSGDIDDVCIYGRDLSAVEFELLAVPESISEILSVPLQDRTVAQKRKLTQYYLEEHAPAEFREAQQHLAVLKQRRTKLMEEIPTVMVMQEMAQPRKTCVLQRGQYDRPGVQVAPGVPAVFPELPVKGPPNRLGFARWLTSPDHPLTSRVLANRLWQQFFGTGLVRTSEDFGSQGDPPSHPELLDWLATELIRTQWDVKSLQRKIVTSATYRQSSWTSPEHLQSDPDNRLLARGPRRRLSAEIIRDQALFVSGLLAQRLGGPSVKPYQPEGLWKEIATDTEYVQSHGPDLYRRSLYTYWKRTVAPPMLMTLDATSREACTVQRSRTNTPLQALALMNDVTFVEAARVLAQSVLAVEIDSEARLRSAFRRVTARDPAPAELRILQSRYEQSLFEFRRDPDSARRLIDAGEFPVDETLDASELAAFTIITSLILNLDEIVTSQ